MKPEIMWCMTFPADNDRGFHLTWCVMRTRKECWKEWLGDDLNEQRSYERDGYKPIKVSVEPF